MGLIILILLSNKKYDNNKLIDNWNNKDTFFRKPFIIKNDK